MLPAGWLLFAALSLPPAALAEETAHLLFERTIHSSTRESRHVVQPGESLIRIIRKNWGVLPAAQREKLLTEIMDLNTTIANPDLIHPGQVLLLPEGSKPILLPDQTVTYVIRPGDTITRILTREMHISPRDLQRALILVRQLNPDMRNIDRIYPGEKILLPGTSTAGTPWAIGRRSSQEAFLATGAEGITAEALPSAKLSFFREVLRRMNGTITTAGNHYIPLRQEGQVVIDCAMVPLVELDDGSVIAVDFRGRISDRLKTVIPEAWPNYSFPRFTGKENAIAILEKVINASGSYRMSRVSEPMSIGRSPRITVAVDWIISAKNPPEGAPITQGLSLLRNVSDIMPAAIDAYLKKHGATITEVAGDAVARNEASPVLHCEKTSLGAGGGAALASSLLESLGYHVEKDAALQVFEAPQDDFNLTVTADLLVTDGERKVAIVEKNVPAQFQKILQAKGVDLLSLPPGEARLRVIERTLAAMNIPSAQGVFSFAYPAVEGESRQTISFPAVKIRRKKSSCYLVDFAMDAGLQCLLEETRGVRIVRY